MEEQEHCATKEKKTKNSVFPANAELGPISICESSRSTNSQKRWASTEATAGQPQMGQGAFLVFRCDMSTLLLGILTN